MTNIDHIVALSVGETFTKSQRMPDTATVKDLRKLSTSITNTFRSAAIRAAERTGLQYHVDKAFNITKSGNFMVSVFVTAYKE